MNAALAHVVKEHVGEGLNALMREGRDVAITCLEASHMAVRATCIIKALRPAHDRGVLGIAHLRHGQCAAVEDDRIEHGIGRIRCAIRVGHRTRVLALGAIVDRMQ